MPLRSPTAPTTIGTFLSRFAGAFASIFFPGRCRLCDELLVDARGVPLCDHCVFSFQEVPEGSCDICGLPGVFDPEFPKERAVCPDCQRHRFDFDLARSLGCYEGALARAIVLLKHEPIEPLGRWFAVRLSELAHRQGERMLADVLIPVPLHRLRNKERGYNQVDLFARPLARKLKLPYHPVLLMRSRPRPETRLLRREERWEAVRGAFAIRQGSRVDNLRVLLLDDVMTTGATLDACSRALRAAGAKAILGLTLARAVRLPGGEPLS